jgi:Protein of unknown function (DUF2971)
MNESARIVGCEAVRKHISTPIPETLWHYTSYAAFEKILTSKSIWASDYRFLNDREEFRHCRKLVFELAETQVEFTKDQLPAREFLIKALNFAFNTGPLEESRLRIMVASFSEHGDQLSQWRGYAGQSTGVSIGLDLRALRPAPHIDTYVVFAPCVYRLEEKRALLLAIFTHFFESLGNYWNGVGNEAKRQSGLTPETLQQLVLSHNNDLGVIMQDALFHLQSDLLRIGPLMKDESFHEEKEWRLVLPSEMIRMPMKHKIEFRAVRDALVPFIAYPLLLENQDGPILCTDLILGPGSHPNAEVGVNLLFQALFITTRTRASKVPYRPA